MEIKDLENEKSKNNEKLVLFRIKSIYIPETQCNVEFATAKGFINWVGKGAVYRTEKPDDEGNYCYYALTDYGVHGMFKTKGFILEEKR